MTHPQRKKKMAHQKKAEISDKRAPQWL
jgi:hypothetical protein